MLFWEKEGFHEGERVKAGESKRERSSLLLFGQHYMLPLKERRE